MAKMSKITQRVLNKVHRLEVTCSPILPFKI